MFKHEFAFGSPAIKPVLGVMKLFFFLFFSAITQAGSYSTTYKANYPVEPVYTSVEEACRASVNNRLWPNNYSGHAYFAPRQEYHCYCFQSPGSICGYAWPQCRQEEYYNTSLRVCSDLPPALTMGDPTQGSGPQTCTGNPIDFSFGNKFQREVDYAESSGSGLLFSRSYNSLNSYWKHNYSARIQGLVNSEIQVALPDGREVIYKRSGKGYVSKNGDIGLLTLAGEEWTYLSSGNELFRFNSAGKLTQFRDRHANTFDLAYGSGEIVVTDKQGRALTFTEDINQQPLTLSAQGVSIVYKYDDRKRLITLTRTPGSTAASRNYHYEDARNPRLLTGITDERGVRFATWAYDELGRAISSVHAGETDKAEISYSLDGTVTVTNSLNKSTKYSFAAIQFMRRVVSIEGEPSTNCPSSNSTFTYDARGLVKTRTDNKGNLTTYGYNARGLEISRTEASGTPLARTITTDWHPTLFLPTVVTEPDRITTYHYDDQGRQLSRTVEER